MRPAGIIRCHGVHGPVGLYTTWHPSLLTVIISCIILHIICLITPARRLTMATQIVRTTFALPADLLAAVDQAVQAGQARSRNAWVARALQRELAAQQRAAIDAAFAAMANDPAYHA